MKKIMLWVLLATLVISSLTGLTSCSKDDNHSTLDVVALEQSLVGLWWDEYEYADVTETGVPFTRVLLAVIADADHTGCIYLGAFDDKSDNPLAVYGGPEDAGFTWKLLTNGMILLGDPVTGETYALAPKRSTATRGNGDGSYGSDMTDVSGTKVTYTGGDNLALTNDDYSGTLTKANAEQEADIKEKLETIITAVDGDDTGIGFGGSTDGPAKAPRH